MTTYELTTGSREEYEEIKTQVISEFIQQVTGAEVNNQLLGHGHITSCLNACNTLESLIFTVHYDLDETKNYGAVVALSSGSLKFVDTSLDTVWDDFIVEQGKLKSQYNKFVEDDRRREKEEAKKAEQLKKAEASAAKQKEHNIKEFNKRASQSKCEVKETSNFFYALGWLSTHVTSVSATLPDYLESAFVKHFGEAPHRTIDSSKRTSGGYAMQWTWSFKMHLKNSETIPMTLNSKVNDTGKIIADTSFIWDLVSDYGFKFGKEQDVVEIMRHVPIEYVPMFVEGSKA